MPTFANGESAASVRTKINDAIDKVDGAAAITSVNIDSGAIDGVTLGTNSAVTEAQIDNININGNAIISTNTDGNIALTPNGTGEVDISKVDIDGGAIDGTVIGGASAAAGTFTTATATTGNITTVNATTVDATDVEVTNIKAKDGTASATIANSTGVMTIASSVLTTADINGGTIDGVSIGASTAATLINVDNLSLNGNTISSTDSNGNIVLAPNGTGDVQLDADTVRVGDSNADVTVTTNGTGDLILNTNAGTNSGTIRIYDGASGNIAITPNGTGEVDISKVDIDGGTIDGVTIGGASAGAGTFTTLTATGDVDIADKIVHTGDTNTAIRFPAADTVTVETAGVEALRIDSSQNVGIGTSSPYGRLTVIPSTTPTSIATATQVSIGESSSNSAYALRLGYYLESGSYKSSVQSIAGGVVAALSLNGDGGNVGINTGSPISPLHINVGTDQNLRVFSAGSAPTIGSLNDANTAYAPLGYAGSQHEFRLGTSEAMRIDSSGNVGIGTSSPAVRLDVSGTIATTGDIIVDLASNNGSVTIRDAGNSSANNAVEVHIRPDAGKSGWLSFTENAVADVAAIGIANGVNALLIKTGTFAGTERMRIDSSGNLLIGSTGTPTSSVGNIVLYNGTAPTGNATNGIILYAEDVSSSSELKVRDEAGNVTTLSPHNFDLIPEGPSEEMAWSYYSERDGKRINVDMLKAIRLLEQLTGEKLVHMA